ncbi:MAG: hypothetical protein IH985_08255, partial [Planctomycetes bacterium]|nr:hypothetical protein [Planctomycetota bacterium]
MIPRLHCILVITLIALTGASSAGAQTHKVWIDDPADAVLRLTNPNGTIHPNSTLPDVSTIVISGWLPDNPLLDPFTGSFINTRDAHIFRLDIIFSGLVNPPGPIALGAQEFDPFRFGVSPVYGFLDLDIDDNKDSGGELSLPAELRYLANVARFGRVPQGSIGGRAARSAQDIDQDFFSAPFYERTGADFAVALCGCWAVEIVFEGGNGDGIFNPGETWLVSGRFLERARGYVGASGAFGGSAPGHYDPVTIIRFQHILATDSTIITLVEPLDMIGAAILAGQPAQPANFSLFDHTSVLEALTDIIFGAGGPLSGPVFELTRLWRGRNAADYMDVDNWQVTALFGTSYTSINASLYAWTDTGFDETPGDVNADALADDADIAMIRDEVYARDGGPTDADGIKNGRVVLIDFGTNFSLFDIDGNGVIEPEDLWLYGHRADLDRNGVLDIFDFLQMQALFVHRDPRADFNLDERFDLFDILVRVRGNVLSVVEAKLVLQGHPLFIGWIEAGEHGEGGHHGQSQRCDMD